MTCNYLNVSQEHILSILTINRSYIVRKFTDVRIFTDLVRKSTYLSVNLRTWVFLCGVGLLKLEYFRYLALYEPCSLVNSKPTPLPLVETKSSMKSAIIGTSETSYKQATPQSQTTWTALRKRREVRFEFPRMIFFTVLFD